MKVWALPLIAAVFSFTTSAQVQLGPVEDSPRAAAEARRLAQIERDKQIAAYSRLKAISDTQYVRNAALISDTNGRFVGLNPNLTDSDKQAITVGEDIRKKYSELLKAGKSGAIRLQNADVCTPNKLIVTATGGCPNNVVAKATAFSFRTGTYMPPILSDVFFKGTNLIAGGAYTIGIFSSLGDTDFKSTRLESDGVKQLAEFNPPSNLREFERQSAILRRGVTVGNFSYLPHAEVAPGSVFVLRTVAYRANLFRGEKPRRINILADDERADVLLVFKVETILGDGSAVLIWRELRKSSPPDVVLEAPAPKPINSNKLLSSLTQRTETY